jgi:hypothetical protein
MHLTQALTENFFKINNIRDEEFDTLIEFGA